MGSLEVHPLFWIRSSASVQEAAEVMSTRSIGALGVRDEDHCFVGIVTERDLTWFVANDGNPRFKRVGDIVNDFPVIEDAPITTEEATHRMTTAHVRHLVIRQGGEYGIVSMRDVMVDREKERIVAADIMSAPAIACREDAYFEEIAEILWARDISGMAVVDSSGELVGVVSERDLAHAMGGPMVRLALRRHKDPLPNEELHDLPRGSRRARDIMSTPPIAVAPSTPLDELARLLRTHQVNRLPVTDEGELIGIITRGDVLGAVAHLEHRSVELEPPVVVGGGGLEWFPMGD